MRMRERERVARVAKWCGDRRAALFRRLLPSHAEPVEQLYHEWKWPLLLTLLSVGAVWYTEADNNKRNTLAFFASAFGAASFYFTYFFGNFNRVKKQQNTEKLLRQIEHRIGGNVSALEDRTDEIIGHVTGGDSFCYLQLTRGALPAFLSHQGKFPLYDLKFTVQDRHQVAAYFQQPGANGLGFLALQSHYSNDLVLPNLATMVPNFVTPSVVAGFISLQLNFYARNGTFTQILKVQVQGGVWRSATKVHRTPPGQQAPVEIFRFVDDQYPRLPDGEVDWS